MTDAETKIANQREEIARLRKTLDTLMGFEKAEPVESREYPVADALRRAGYFRLPRWYVTQDQLDVIERMAKGNKEEVFRIKREAGNAEG